MRKNDMLDCPVKFRNSANKVLKRDYDDYSWFNMGRVTDHKVGIYDIR